MSLDHSQEFWQHTITNLESAQRIQSMLQILKAAMDPFRPRDIEISVEHGETFFDKVISVRLGSWPSYELRFELKDDDLRRLYDMDSLQWLGEAFAQQFLAVMEDVGDHIELGDN